MGNDGSAMESNFFIIFEDLCREIFSKLLINLFLREFVQLEIRS